MENEFDLFTQRKMEDEDPLRLWFYAELLTQKLMKLLEEKMASNEA